MNAAIEDLRNQKFEAWRHGLLDVSRRNRLISYRRTRRSTLLILDPGPQQLYERLVQKGERLSFRRQIPVLDNPRLSGLFYLMDKVGAPVELAEGEVRSDLSTGEMNRTLQYIRSRARLAREEQGVHALYLSIGFLSWQQKPSDPFILSPLILVPVELELASLVSPFRLRRYDEDIVVNPTLEYVLKTEYGVTLPPFDPQRQDPFVWLDQLAAQVASSGWSVVSQANLGLLSFLKMMMYRDLEKDRERIFAHPVIRAFCGEPQALPPIGEELRSADHDRTPALDVCQVVNADASQQDAVLLSRRGCSFVLQGPPGTGKSQTITNIIAQALADRKKVLFVSEKMAALSVVYRRLESVGLADYCLSLHNYKADKRAVLQDLVKTLDAPVRTVRPGAAEMLENLEAERASLNAYVAALHRPRTPLDRTVYQVVTELAALPDVPFRYLSGDTLSVSARELGARFSLLRDVADFLRQSPGALQDNPWQDAGLRLISYETQDFIVHRLQPLSGFLFGLAGSLAYLDQTQNADNPWPLRDFRALLEAWRDTRLFQRLDALLQSRAGVSPLTPETLDALDQTRRLLLESHVQSSAPRPDGLRQALRQKMEGLRQSTHSLLEARQLFSQLLPQSVVSLPRSSEEALEKLSGLTAILRRALERKESAAAFFRRLGYDPSESFLAEVEELFEPWLDPAALPDLVHRLSEHYFALNPGEFARALSGSVAGLQEPPQHADLSVFLSWFPGTDLNALPLQRLSERADRCRDTEALRAWMRWAGLALQAEKLDLSDMLSAARDGLLAPEDLETVYRKSFLTKWLMQVLEQQSEENLRSFHSALQEKTVASFAVHDEQQLHLARARLAAFLSHEKPSGMQRLLGAADEITLLRREAEKKRKVIPLRRLFRVIPSLLQKLKPCFMMSPLSVSYLLDSELYAFDLVIFDEASQILPEDAVGAIYRGKQVIIAGDTRQMPPTSFFSALASGADAYDAEEPEEEEDLLPDPVSESVLDEASACLPSCTLLWHYRSRDESLIAFSNKLLYGSRLITFPNCARLADRGLEYVYVSDGLYEGGGKNCNLPEARKCLQLILEHMQKYPDRSLGVVAFSEKQQAMIEEVVSDFRLANPQYEAFFDENREEPFFIKNLENVQGDERDTILLSICYARNAQGKMYQRFGPLGHDGGERRLNVAVTRAKYNVKLVGSILPTDIAVKDGTKAGVRMLRDYIYYAMQHDAALPAATDGPKDDFALQLEAFLRQNGYACRRNVGSSRYRVDLAIEAPGDPETLVAGLELDGENYLQARTARDRDVLRRQMMAALGWRLLHIWSMAWYLNPEEEKSRLLRFLQPLAPAIPAPQPEQPAFPEALTEELPKPQGSQKPSLPAYEAADALQAPVHAGADSYTALAARMLFVLQKEAPLHRELLYRRMAVTLGGAQVTSPIRKMVDDCLRRRLADQVTVRGDFLYLPGAPVVARGPGAAGETREIDHICPEEAQLAMSLLLSLAPGLPRSSLLEETARLFGFARAGTHIAAALGRHFHAGLRAGLFREENGLVFSRPDPPARMNRQEDAPHE